MPDPLTRNPAPRRDPLRPAHADAKPPPGGAPNPRPGEDPLARHTRPGRPPTRGGSVGAGNPRPGRDPLHPRGG